MRTNHSAIRNPQSAIQEGWRVRCVTDADGFHALAPHWNSTLTACGVDNVFLTHEWLSTYWEHFHARKRLAVLVAEQNGRPAAFAPLISSGVRGLRTLEFLGAGIHDYSDLIVPQKQPHAALTALLQALDAQDGWDALRLAQVAADSPVVEHFNPQSAIRNPQYQGGNGWRVVATEAETCPTLTLPSSWKDYLSLVSKNMRSNLTRYPRRLAEAFKVEYHLVTSPDTLDSTLAALFRLHGRRWRERGLPGVLFSPKRQRFHRALCRTLLERDRLRLFSLKLDGREVAVLLNYYYAGKYFFFIGGFDPGLSRWSVGTVLFGYAIQHAMEEGAREFDFLRGKEEYKYRLGAQDRAYQTLKVIKPHWRSSALARWMQWEEALQARARKWAAKW